MMIDSPEIAAAEKIILHLKIVLGNVQRIAAGIKTDIAYPVVLL